MITKFNPCIKGLRKRFLMYWNNTQQDKVGSNLHTHLPMITYNKHKNIGYLIIIPKLKVNVTPTD